MSAIKTHEILLTALLISVGIKSAEVRKLPHYDLPLSIKGEYKEAVSLIDKWGNSNEFFSYVLKKRKYFSHANATAVEAVRQFRDCLARGDTYEFIFLSLDKRVIGRWTGKEMKQNVNVTLSAIERAGHLYHETAHACGFRHKGDEWTEHDNLNSFPYAIGYDFEDFIKTKRGYK